MKLNGRSSNKTLVALVIVGLVLTLVGTFTEHKVLGFGGTVGGLMAYFSVQFLLIALSAKKQFRQKNFAKTGH